MLFGTVNLHRSCSYTNSSLPSVEATIIKNRHASKRIPFSPLKPAQALKVCLAPRKGQTEMLHRSESACDQIE